MPPVRCGSSAASSPIHRHTISPITTTRAMAGMAAAPMEETAKGTMPVTKMVPARPMTTAPHQLVPRLNDVATSAGPLLTAVPDSLICLSPRVTRCRCDWLVSNLRVRPGWSYGAQVAIQLPGRHFRVRGAGLSALGGHEVVHVVTFRGLAEALP